MSKRVVWLTDIHLNFLSDTRVDAFLGDVASQRPDSVLIGGDIAEAHNVPGKVLEHTWRRRLDRSLTETMTDPEVERRLRLLADRRRG